MALITEPGAYADIAAEDYHGNADLLPELSLSSSGMKLLLAKSPRHFWHASPLNPNRQEQDKPHYAIGKAAHDLILLPNRWHDFYHVLPEGFTRAGTKKWATAIEEADAAQESGLTILRHEDAETAQRMADVLRSNEYAVMALTNGVTEETLVWRDPITGRWFRARTDFRPNSILARQRVRIVPDLKFVAPEHASPDGFRRAIHRFGYHMTAAHYWDGIKAVFGIAPTHWVHVVVEKEEPHCVSLYELPAEDIERGRAECRKAAFLFDRCMSEGHWPGYADTPAPVGLPEWARKNLDFEHQMAAAA